MPLVKLSIKDRFSESVLEKIYTCPDVSVAADKFSAKYPDCWVSLVEVEDNAIHATVCGGDFAYCPPLNMTKDEILVEFDEMDLKAYQLKWYPGTDKLAAIYQEDIELQLANTEEFEYDLPDPDCD